MTDGPIINYACYEGQVGSGSNIYHLFKIAGEAQTMRTNKALINEAFGNPKGSVKFGGSYAETGYDGTPSFVFIIAKAENLGISRGHDADDVFAKTVRPYMVDKGLTNSALELKFNG